MVAEQFNTISLATLASTIDAGSDLIKLRTFEDEPNPGLSAFDLMNFDADAAVPAMMFTGARQRSGHRLDRRGRPVRLRPGRPGLCDGSGHPTALHAYASAMTSTACGR